MPTHSQAHFIFFVPQKIKRACLFPPLPEESLFTRFELILLYYFQKD